MSYTKTTWVNNTTPINETNLNKIEQGIYDNSLVVDAVTNTLNPTDTETYKTAELTEGQITDVIGVNDIVIKGQTSQDGTPTPSAPVDVNVVSGSNLINIYNNQTLGKELRLDLPIENLIGNTFNQGGIDFGGSGGTTAAANRINTDYIAVMPNTTYTIANYNTNIYQFGAGLYKYNKVYDSDHKIISGAWVNFPYTFTTQSDTYFVKFAFKNEENTNLSPTGDYKIMFNRGSLSNAYTASGTEPIELCKIGNYQDYFYKSGSKWYLHKEIGKVIYDGSENWEDRPNYTNADRFVVSDKTIPIQNQSVECYSDYFDVANLLTDDFPKLILNSGEQIVVNYSTKGTTSLSQFKDWLSTHNTNVYYYLLTPTNTEITDTTLISQLEAIYNAPLYEQTNITQTNNDLPMVLDITACKDNINGIKAFIRK